MAKIVRINHVAFAVKDMDEAIRSAVENLGGELMLKFECTDKHYKGACIQLGESIISVLEPTDDSSFIAQHIKSRGTGVQHIGLEIDNLEEYVDHLEQQGVKVDKSQLRDETFPEALLGPKAGNGVVLQLTQWRGGHLDVSPEGKERLRQKYLTGDNLRVIE